MSSNTKGSQYQLQRYVNEHRGELNAKISAALPALEPWSIEWISPLAADGYREYYDAGFLNALGLQEHADALADFWPARGPRWDALATLTRDTARGALLVEAKAHTAEIETGGCGASAQSSIDKIRRALAAAAERSGASAALDDWFDKRYQQANRLAHLYFFEKVSVPAWLVNIYFVDDKSHIPTTRENWTEALERAKTDMALNSAALPRSADVFVEAIND